MPFLMVDKELIEEFLKERVTPFSKAEAFISLVYSVDSARNPGRFCTSRGQLADRWGWTRDKVRAFLTGLERGGQIELCYENRETIVHWGKNAPQLRPTSAQATPNQRPIESNNIIPLIISLDPTSAQATPNQRPLLDTKTKRLDTEDLTKKRSTSKIRGGKILPTVVTPPGARDGITPIGAFKNVYISAEEGRTLVEKFGRDIVLAKITSMSTKIYDGARKYKAYKNHAVTIRGWLEEDSSKIVRHIHETIPNSNARMFEKNIEYCRRRDAEEEAEGMFNCFSSSEEELGIDDGCGGSLVLLIGDGERH